MRLLLLAPLFCVIGCVATTYHKVEQQENTGADQEVAQIDSTPSRKKDHKYVARRDWIVCTRESVVGSHFKTRRCRTAAQMAAERELLPDSDGLIQYGSDRPVLAEKR